MAVTIDHNPRCSKPREALKLIEARGITLNRLLVERMVANPALIERPIVVVGNKARIDRPPENVLEIL